MPLIQNNSPSYIYQDLVTLQTLSQSKFDFHLTGSRYFDHVHEKSDWDYFVQNSPEVLTFLKQEGFKRTPAKCYASIDQGLITVYEKGLVQVQLVKDVKFKQLVQLYIVQNPSLRDRLQNKVDARKVWEEVSKLCRKILNIHSTL